MQMYTYMYKLTCVSPNQYILSGKFITLCCRFSGRENNQVKLGGKFTDTKFGYTCTND